MSISVSSNLKQVSRGLSELQKSVLPMATAKALTFAAEAGQKEIVSLMPKVFDRPTPYTLRSTYIKAATVSNPEAFVYLKQFGGKGVSADRYLLPEIEGGPRRQKSAERRLEPLMRGFKFMVPAAGATLDQYGNAKGSEIARILSQLGVSEAGQNANRRGARRGKGRKVEQYFVPGPGSPLRAGIYKRARRGIVPVFIFAGHATYRERLPFYVRGMAAAREAFPIKLQEQIERELRRLLPQ